VKVFKLREGEGRAIVVLQGRDGAKQAVYELVPAGRKFGLSLQKASEYALALLRIPRR
jgi:hypothetical protein